MLTTNTELTRRTPAAEAFYCIKHDDNASFHTRRPVIVYRSGTGSIGTSLEYSPTGGRNWQIVSFHGNTVEAIEAFHAIGSGKDRDPLHYRILMES